MRRSVLIAVVSALLGAPSLAMADMQMVDLGQSGMLSTVPQAPVAVPLRGDCPQPRDPAEANGAASRCPAGTWPEPGSADWYGPTPVDAAGGDTLQLRFPGPVTTLAVTGTTTLPIGLREPCAPLPPPGTSPPGCVGEPVPNRDLGDLQPTASADPAVWTIVLPTLDPVFRQATDMAVTALATGGAQNYAFVLRGPRYVDAATRCGPTWVNTGVAGYSGCGGSVKAPPPPPSTPAMSTPPPDTPGRRATARRPRDPAWRTVAPDGQRLGTRSRRHRPEARRPGAGAPASGRRRTRSQAAARHAVTPDAEAAGPPSPVALRAHRHADVVLRFEHRDDERTVATVASVRTESAAPSPRGASGSVWLSQDVMR